MEIAFPSHIHLIMYQRSYKKNYSTYCIRGWKNQDSASTKTYISIIQYDQI